MLDAAIRDVEALEGISTATSSSIETIVQEAEDDDGDREEEDTSIRERQETRPGSNEPSAGRCLRLCRSALAARSRAVEGSEAAAKALTALAKRTMQELAALAAEHEERAVSLRATAAAKRDEARDAATRAGKAASWLHEEGGGQRANAQALAAAAEGWRRHADAADAEGRR